MNQYALFSIKIPVDYYYPYHTGQGEVLQVTDRIYQRDHGR